MKKAWILLAVVCALVLGVYAYMSQSGVLELLSPNAADAYYNLLAQGFQAGQLNLKKEVPPGLTKLADPYDPAANVVYWSPPYRLLDLSYYKGKLYFYWGVTPAVILFWPYVALTGQYLFHRQAVVIFCALGFLVSIGLLRGLWRRHFPNASVGVVLACALALGLATGVPFLLSQSDVYAVPISCGYMLTMLTLGAIWCSLHEPEPRKRSGWLALASVAYGLAVGARVTLLFGAVVLLVPVIQTWRERRQVWVVLLAAVGPITLIGLGLMLYNNLRFDNPFEFGQRYQLAGERQMTRQFFNLRYLWFNFRVYFLEPAHWNAHFPFAQNITVPPLPVGYSQVRRPFGVLTSIPVVWLALAAPLAWRGRPGTEGSTLRWFVAAVALLFGICAFTLALFESAAIRYEVDFIPALVLLAVVGILGVERALAGQPARRRAARWGWSLLLGVSVAFNLLACGENYAEAYNSLGSELFQAGKVPEAINQYEKALRFKPDFAEAYSKLGVALVRLGRVPEAIEQYHQALRISPNDAEAHNNLGATLGQVGKLPEAIGEFETALRIKPDYAEAHCNLGVALGQAGRTQEAIDHWEEALRLKPDYVAAHNNLAGALNQEGKTDDAIRHYEQALQIRPDYVEVHYNLGVVLERAGRFPEAIAQYQQALRIRPDFIEARNALTRLQAQPPTP